MLLVSRFWGRGRSVVITLDGDDRLQLNSCRNSASADIDWLHQGMLWKECSGVQRARGPLLWLLCRFSCVQSSLICALNGLQTQKGMTGEALCISTLVHMLSESRNFRAGMPRL